MYALKNYSFSEYGMKHNSLQKYIQVIFTFHRDKPADVSE